MAARPATTARFASGSGCRSPAAREAGQGAAARHREEADHAKRSTTSVRATHGVVGGWGGGEGGGVVWSHFSIVELEIVFFSGASPIEPLWSIPYARALRGAGFGAGFEVLPKGLLVDSRPKQWE